MPDATHILISFCNTPPGAPALALFDIERGVVTVPHVPEIASHGATGLAVHGELLFVMTSKLQRDLQPSVDPPNPSVLFVLNRRDLSRLTQYTCASVFDGHSIMARDRALDVVSTGSDEVVRLHFHGPAVVKEEVIWRADPIGPRTDLHHLNAIGLWKDQTVITGFGRKTNITWSSAGEGFVKVLPDDRILETGVRHPHSLLDLDGVLAYCQSGTTSVHKHGERASQVLPGYTRGLARAGNRVFVGTSKGRRVSKSTGHLTNRGDPGATAGRCGLALLDAVTFDVEAFVDLSTYGAEIYDLLAVSDVDSWPIQSDMGWRDQYLAGLWTQHEHSSATVAWLHTEVGQRDATIEWLHREVAERDRTIASLHEEVARRDSHVAQLEARLRALEP